MICQVEITTFCNAKCFYCPNEFMEHEHMPFDLFRELLESFPADAGVLLQGTGEPLLHPLFWQMVDAVKKRNHWVSVITNGTIPITDEQLHLLDSIGFSIDTLCSNTARKHGRPDPFPILRNLLDYHRHVPHKIKIYTVDYGQNILPLRFFALDNTVSITVQNLQPKTTYQVRYRTEHLPYRHYRCRYIENDIVRFYFIDKKQSPCSFMIDRKSALTKEEVHMYLSEGRVPECCSQCGELTGLSRLSYREEVRC